METYKPWDFCKSIDCDVLNIINKETQADSCLRCKTYQMHQYLRGHGQILEEGSALQTQLSMDKADKTVLTDLILDHRKQLAEAQADNAGIVDKLKRYMREVYDYDMDGEDMLPSGAEGKYCEGIFEAIEIIEDCKNNHPGAPLLAELDQLRKENANYKDIVGLSCEEYRMHREKIALLEAELVHLRRVRDAAEKAIYTKSQVGKTRYEYDFSKALCQVQLALAQAKGAE